MKNLRLYIIAFLTILTYSGMTQELEFFFDTENSIDCQRVQEDENGDYVLIGNMHDTSGHYSAYILKLDNNFDTTYRKVENSDDDILVQDFIVLPGNEYFVIGTVGKNSDNHSNVSFIQITKFNQNLEVIAEKQYAMDNNGNYHDPDIKVLLNDDGKIYSIASFLGTFLPGGYFNVLMQFNMLGDTLRTRSYVSLYSTGLSDINSLMNNNGNISGIYGTATGFSSFTPLQILEIDTNFNIDVFEVNNSGGNMFQFSSRFTTKWLTDSTYLLLNSEFPDTSYTADIFVAKFNTAHEIVGEPIWVGRPDTSDWVPRYGMDWVDPENIFICAYQFVYHVPWEVNQLVALIDSGLNVKGMKYYGENLNFGIRTLCATSDGGAILPVGQHDYNNPAIDMDLIIWKISADDLITSAAETPNPFDSDYFIFPNPGDEFFHVQTARKGVVLEIYNNQGRLVLSKKLEDTYLNEINTSLLQSGTYIYKLTDNEGFTESGKWIKN